MENQESSKTIARNTMLLYVRMLLVMLVSLFTSRVVLEQLGVVDYGIYNVVGGVVVMLSFLNAAISTSTQRFLSLELGHFNEDRLNKTFRTAITIHLLIGGIILFLSETIGLWFVNRVMEIPMSQMTAANMVYQCAVMGCVVSIMQIPFNAVIISRERMRIYTGLGIIEVILRLGVAFSLVLFTGDKLIIYAYLTLGMGILMTVSLILVCKKKFRECTLRPLYEKSLFHDMIGFASWTTIGSLSWVGRTQGCNIILNLFYGPAVNAAFSISGQVCVAINRFVLNFNTAVNPRIVKNYSQDAYESMQRLMMAGSKYSFCLLLLISFPMLMTMQPILQLWLGKVPAYTVVFTQLIIVNSLIESFSYSMGTGIRAVGKVKWYEILVGCTLLLNVPVSYILLKFGCLPQSIFLVMISLSVLTIVLRLVLMSQYIPEFSMSRFSRIVFVPSAAVGVVCGLAYYIYHRLGLSGNVNPLLTIALSLFMVLILEYYICLSRRERKIIRHFLRSKISRSPGIPPISTGQNGFHEELKEHNCLHDKF